jgi:hypothetical protein
VFAQFRDLAIKEYLASEAFCNVTTADIHKSAMVR